VHYQPPPGVSLGLSLAKDFLIGIALTLALGLGLSVTDRADRSSAPAVDPESSRAARLMERFECSETGFGSEVIPNSALIHLDGRVKRVSFDRGWAVFTGDEPGTLMAVCLK
jgi:hypothetical protein